MSFLHSLLAENIDAGMIVSVVGGRASPRFIQIIMLLEQPCVKECTVAGGWVEKEYSLPSTHAETRRPHHIALLCCRHVVCRE